MVARLVFPQPPKSSPTNYALLKRHSYQEETNKFGGGGMGDLNVGLGGPWNPLGLFQHQQHPTAGPPGPIGSGIPGPQGPPGQQATPTTPGVVLR